MVRSRWRFACWLAVLVLAGPLSPATASDSDFPFGRELMLDAPPMPGSKRIPTLEIEENGAASIDLWCVSLHGTATVGDGTFGIISGPAAPAQCTPERLSADQNLLTTLLGVTKWRRDGEVIELSGAATLRFRLMTN